MAAYYNEIDRQKAAWLRELIRQGHIAKGDVDERSIKDVAADDLRGYTQCHFFAGVGVWSYALRLAGWPDDRQVWTGSCPCQSFSVAGKKKGFADARHLWPDWFRLIAQRTPGVVLGEQSASKDALAWLDLVHSNLEEAGYACGSVDIPASGFGAPHIRQRLYFVADTESAERWPEHQEYADAYRGNGPGGCGGVGVLEHATCNGRQQRWPESGGGSTKSRCGDSELADANGWHPCAEREQRSGQYGQQPQNGCAGGLANANRLFTEQPARQGSGPAEAEGRRSLGQLTRCGDDGRSGPTNGFWGVVDWLFCTDGKWRPVEAGTSPLAHGAPARVGRLRGYGDAIVAEVAAHFIEAYMSVSRTK